MKSIKFILFVLALTLGSTAQAQSQQPLVKNHWLFNAGAQMLGQPYTRAPQNAFTGVNKAFQAPQAQYPQQRPFYTPPPVQQPRQDMTIRRMGSWTTVEIGEETFNCSTMGTTTRCW